MGNIQKAAGVINLQNPHRVAMLKPNSLTGTFRVPIQCQAQCNRAIGGGQGIRIAEVDFLLTVRVLSDQMLYDQHVQLFVIAGGS